MNTHCPACKKILPYGMHLKKKHICEYCETTLINDLPIYYLIPAWALSVLLLIAFAQSSSSSGGAALGKLIGLLLVMPFIIFFGNPLRPDTTTTNNSKLEKILIDHSLNFKQQAKNIDANIASFKNEQLMKSQNKKWWQFWL